MFKLSFNGAEKIIFHCIIIILATGIGMCGFIFSERNKLSTEIILLIQTGILILLCIIHIISVFNYSKCKHNCNRIKREYLRVVKRQTYKLNRLSETEKQLLKYIINDCRINDISSRMRLTTFSLFHCVNRIRQKLEIPMQESPFDVDWKSVLG